MVRCSQHRASRRSAAFSCTGATRRFFHRNPLENRLAVIVTGRICVADGRIASVRAGRISVVPAVDAAVSSLTLHAANHHMDSEHHSYLRRLAFTYTWTSLVGSWLGYAGGIRIRGNSRCNYLAAPA
jgi:hypothetical protein